jgi:RNA polymerase sigma-70 factor (ECF subfamily)
MQPDERCRLLAPASDHDGGVGYEQADLDELARAVLARRADLGMSQEDVAAAGGPSVATLRLIEGARQSSYRSLTLGALDRALLWRPGHALRILQRRSDEADLPARERAGSFEEFYRANYPWVVEHLRRRFGDEGAEDVAQEAFLRANVAGLPGSTDHPLPWLLRVADHIAFAHSRRRVRHLLDLEVVTAVETATAGPETEFELREEKQRLLQAIRRLGEQERSILLARGSGDSIADIASKLGTNPSAVRIRLYRARTALTRSFLQDETAR